MDIGIAMFVTGTSLDSAVLAENCEKMGFESLWVPEHPVIPAGDKTKWPGSTDGILPEEYYNIVDPFVALARASMVTTTLKLATGICLIPERNPLMLAKEIASLDYFSNGRFLFGIGTGWLREETELFGVNFKDRVKYTRESILSMKELWTQEEAEFHGDLIDFPPVICMPKPIQKPHPPVLIGGMAKNVFRRVVNWGDGWMPNRVTPEDIRQGRIEIDKLCKECGRDPNSISISVYGQPADAELLKAFESAGADRVMVRLATASEEPALESLQEIASKVLA